MLPVSSDTPGLLSATLSHWKGASQSIALQHTVKGNRLRKCERGGNLDNTQQLRAGSPGMSRQQSQVADAADLGLHFCNIWSSLYP